MSPTVLLELRRSAVFDYRLVGVNAGAPVPAQQILDGFYQVPIGNSPDFVPALLEVVRRERVDLVLPWSDEEAFAVSSATSELMACDARALVSPPECLRLIVDKFATYRNLAEAGLAVPEYTAVRDVNSLLEALDSYDYPAKSVVIKPARGTGGRGLYVLCGLDNPPRWLGRGKREKRAEVTSFDRERLASFIEGESLVMPCLKTPAYDADVLFVGSENYAVVVRKRFNPTGIPFEGNRIISEPAVVEYCRNIAAALGLKALHDIDLMTDDTGRPVVLEVNPRPSGSLAATLSAGFPILDWAVAQVMGITFEVFEPKRDLEILSFPRTFAVSAE